MELFYKLFYCVVLGFLSQNLALALGVGSGNLLKLSKEEYKGKRKYFFLVMLVVSALSSLICKAVDLITIAVPDDVLNFLRPLLYIIVIALLEILLETVISYALPTVREKIGDMLPAAAFNSCVLAILLLNNQMESGIFESFVFAITATAGFAFSVILMRALRERIHLAHCPDFMKGVPIALLAAGALSMAFMGVMNLTFPYAIN